MLLLKNGVCRIPRQADRKKSFPTSNFVKKLTVPPRSRIWLFPSYTIHYVQEVLNTFSGFPLRWTRGSWTRPREVIVGRLVPKRPLFSALTILPLNPVRYFWEIARSSCWQEAFPFLEQNFLGNVRTYPAYLTRVVQQQQRGGGKRRKSVASHPLAHITRKCHFPVPLPHFRFFCTFPTFPPLPLGSVILRCPKGQHPKRKTKAT